MSPYAPPVMSPVPATEQIPGFKHLYAQRGADFSHVSASLLYKLDQVAQRLGVTITVFSGYRSPSYSQAHGGYSTDPHTRGVAVDANINGKPAGYYPGFVATAKAYGLESGNQPGFYRGQPDPSHVQVPNSGVNKTIHAVQTWAQWFKAQVSTRPTGASPGSGSTPKQQAPPYGLPSKINPEQSFIFSVATQSGLDPRVIRAWIAGEGNPGDWPGYYNYLNITSDTARSLGFPVKATGPAGIAEFPNLETGVGATVAEITSLGIKPAATPEAELKEIEQSPWASSHYNQTGLESIFTREFGSKAEAGKAATLTPQEAGSAADFWSGKGGGIVIGAATGAALAAALFGIPGAVVGAAGGAAVGAAKKAAQGAAGAGSSAASSGLLGKVLGAAGLGVGAYELRGYAVRGAEIVAGAALALFGIVLLGRAASGGSTSPVSVARRAYGGAGA